MTHYIPKSLEWDVSANGMVHRTKTPFGEMSIMQSSPGVVGTYNDMVRDDHGESEQGCFTSIEEAKKALEFWWSATLLECLHESIRGKRKDAD